MILFEVFLIHFFQVVEVVGAFGIDTLMDDKVFPVFFGDEGISAVRTPQLQGREAAFGGGKPGGADFTEQLAFGTIILVKKWLRAFSFGDVSKAFPLPLLASCYFLASC